MELEFLEKIKTNPELIGITKYRKLNGLVCYSEHINNELIHSVCWVYQNYFSIKITLFIPGIVLDFPDAVVCTLEALEQYVPQKNEIVIFGWCEHIFKDFNKRRLNTLLKNISKKNKTILFSSFSLKCTLLPFLESFEFYELPTMGIQFQNLLDNVSLFDLVDPDPENYNYNVEQFIEFVKEFKNEHRIYMSLNLQPNKLLEIESLLKENGISVSRKDSEQADIVINSCKTTEKAFLKGRYSIFIFSPPLFEESMELVSFFKDIFTNECEIFIDSSKLKNISQHLKMICKESIIPRPIIKDSIDFNSYSEIKKIIESEIIMASECYYNFQAPESLLKLDLMNLTKKDYDLIRNFVKNKLTMKYSLEIKTCQLAAPCSPKDRSKKLNSLSNKISSYDYRCDCTCEIFKDYSIGVIVWNDFFKNRKKINIVNQYFVYQTTYGTWKYTSIV